MAEPRLVAGDWGAERWGWFGPDQKASVASGEISLFGCVFINEAEGKAVVAHKPHPAQPLRVITGDDLDQLRERKRMQWERSGWLTHSDVALWASELLENKEFGAIIRAQVLRRFPLVIVDELQDTGHFLGKSIRLLLSDQLARGVLVGDPNQAIYEFNGARPDLFNGFENITGATSFPLGDSQRCLAPVVAVAKHLKEPSDLFNPATGNSGRAFLLRYADMVNDVRRVVDRIRTVRTVADIKIVVRWNATIGEFMSGKAREISSLRCPALTHMCRAVKAFRQGHNVRALAKSRAALDLAVFGHEGVTDEEIKAQDIDPREWRAFAIRCLLQCNAIDSTVSMQDWQTSVGSLIDQAVQAFGVPESLPFKPGKLKPHNLQKRRKKAGADKPFVEFAPRALRDTGVARDVRLQTVHAVKGETHDVTVFVCPPSTPSRCPSKVWWPTDETDGEERRIAYVAMTRTRGDLVVCVSADSYQRLCEEREEFVDCFQCLTIDEFIDLN